jgi:prepilin-type N-terminal cleavage/methylation domain-containing protein/prepilin-type processing-associated H-X9-DG protein
MQPTITCRTQRFPSRRGFTLIELLVVIAIIAVLAAILFPVFARARENARRASCMSNLKQIGLGLLQYTQDYDEKTPLSWFAPSGYGGDASKPISSGTDAYKWMDAIYPYVKSEQIFDCPSDTFVKDMYTDRKNTEYSFRNGYRYGSYADNHVYSDNPAWSVSGVALAAIEAPATTVWAADSVPLPAPSTNVYSFEFSWPNVGAQPSITVGSPNRLDKIAERHLDTTNVLFCDGHVKSLKLTNLLTKSTSGATVGAYSYFTPQDD